MTDIAASLAQDDSMDLDLAPGLGVTDGTTDLDGARNANNNATTPAPVSLDDEDNAVQTPKKKQRLNAEPSPGNEIAAALGLESPPPPTTVTPNANAGTKVAVFLPRDHRVTKKNPDDPKGPKLSVLKHTLFVGFRVPGANNLNARLAGLQFLFRTRGGFVQYRKSWNGNVPDSDDDDDDDDEPTTFGKTRATTSKKQTPVLRGRDERFHAWASFQDANNANTYVPAAVVSTLKPLAATALISIEPSTPLTEVYYIGLVEALARRHGYDVVKTHLPGAEPTEWFRTWHPLTRPTAIVQPMTRAGKVVGYQATCVIFRDFANDLKNMITDDVADGGSWGFKKAPDGTFPFRFPLTAEAAVRGFFVKQQIPFNGAAFNSAASPTTTTTPTAAETGITTGNTDSLTGREEQGRGSAHDHLFFATTTTTTPTPSP